MKKQLHVRTQMKHLYTFVSMLAIMILFGFTSANAQTLMHSYNFQGNANDGTGSANGTLENGASYHPSGKVILNDGQYISLDATSIAINTYSAVTIEAYVTASNVTFGGNGNATLFYFGNNDPAATWKGYDYLYAQGTTGNSDGTAAISTPGNVGDPWTHEDKVTGPALNDASLHHVVVTLDATTMTYYVDGANQGSVSYTGSNAISALGTELAWIGKAGYTGDPTWQGVIDEFNIYDGAMDEGTVASRAAAYLGGTNANLASLSVSTGTLYPAFSSSETNYSLLVDSGTASVDISGTTEDPSANITSGDGTITLSGGEGTTDVVVTAADNVTTKTYTITIKEDCFTPTYPSGNLVANPSMNGPFSAQTGFSQEWTNFDTKTDTEDACGNSFGSLHVKGSCYPDGGVLLWDSGVAIKPNTSYRIIAKIKNETATSSDVFNFVLNSATWDLTTNDTTGNQTLVGIPTGTGWITFDQTIATGPNASGNVSFLIMSCDSADTGLVTDFLYLDHFEVYDTSTLSTSEFDLSKASFKVYPNPSNGNSFKIDLNSFDDSVNVKVYSILGKEILNKDFSSGSKTIEVNHKLDTGIYIVKLNDKATSKLIVK